VREKSECKLNRQDAKSAKIKGETSEKTCFAGGAGKKGLF
jgi:hypothetical protein